MSCWLDWDAATAMETHFLLTSPDHPVFSRDILAAESMNLQTRLKMASLPCCSPQRPAQAAAWTSSDSLTSGVSLNNNLLEMLLGSSYFWCFFPPANSSRLASKKWSLELHLLWVQVLESTSGKRNALRPASSQTASSLLSHAATMERNKRKKGKKTTNNPLCASWIQTQEHFQLIPVAAAATESKFNTDWCIEQTI